jgi:hypothetical protein
MGISIKFMDYLLEFTVIYRAIGLEIERRDLPYYGRF